MTTGELSSLPASSLDDNAELVKAIVQAYEAFIERLDGARDVRGQQGASWNLHLGVPNPNNMPDEELSVWLNLSTAGPSPDSPMTADLYDSVWEVYVASRETGLDTEGMDPTQGLLTVGAIETRLRSTLDDLSLDDAVEVSTDFDIQHDILSPEDQQDYDLWMLRVGASLGLLNCR